jgi:hypothetical protein
VNVVYTFAQSHQGATMPLPAIFLKHRRIAMPQDLKIVLDLLLRQANSVIVIEDENNPHQRLATEFIAGNLSMKNDPTGSFIVGTGKTGKRAGKETHLRIMKGGAVELRTVDEDHVSDWYRPNNNNTYLLIPL